MILMCIPFLYGGIRSLYTKSNRKPPTPPQQLDGSSLKQQIESDVSFSEQNDSPSNATYEQTVLHNVWSRVDGENAKRAPAKVDSDGSESSSTSNPESKAIKADKPTAQADSVADEYSTQRDPSLDKSPLESSDSDSDVPSALSDSNSDDDEEQNRTDSQPKLTP